MFIVSVTMIISQKIKQNELSCIVINEKVVPTDVLLKFQ